MVGLDDLSALSTSSLAATKDGKPDCSCAAEEAEKGKQNQTRDDTDDNTSNGTARETVRVA